MALQGPLARIKALFAAFAGSNPDANPPTVGVLRLQNGGLGATDAAGARANLGIHTLTCGTADLTAGSSPLATGTSYFVYE